MPLHNDKIATLMDKLHKVRTDIENLQRKEKQYQALIEEMIRTLLK